MRIQLRDYQAKAIADVSAEHRRGHRAVLLVMPTGSGKTVVFSSVADGLSARGIGVGIVVPQVELVRQTSEKLSMFGCRHGVIAASEGPNPDPTALVQVMMAQTLHKRPHALLIRLGYLIFDEAHLAMADTYRAIAERHSHAQFMGTTATPWRLDGRPFSELFSAIVVGSTVPAMLSRGALTPFRTLSIPLTEFATKGRSKTEYSQSAMAEAYAKNALVGDVVEHYHELAHNRTGIVFGASISHSQMLRDRFADAGYRVEHLDGTTPMGQHGDGMRGLPSRTGILERLAAGITQIVCNYGVLTTGFDCPRVSAIVIARATASKSLWIQMAGRGLRPCPEIDKENCIIIDHGGNARRHGNLDHAHAYTLDGRDKARELDQPDATTGKECPRCFFFTPTNTPVCPECSYSWQASLPITVPRAAPESVDGRLVDVASGAAPIAPPKPAKVPTRADRIEMARGWSASWGRN